MASYSGILGACKVGAASGSTAEYYGISNWSLTTTAEAPDVSSFTGAGYRQRVAGLKDWSGSFSVKWDADGTLGSSKIVDLWGTEGYVQLFVNDVATTESFAGPVVFDGYTVNNSVEGSPVLDVTFKANGILITP